MVDTDIDKGAELESLIKSKDKKILSLQKINAENQKLLMEQNEIQKIFIGDEDEKEKQYLNKIKQLKLKNEKLEASSKEKAVKKVDKKQVELMKGAIEKIKKLKTSLDEKNKIIKELKATGTDASEVTSLKALLLDKNKQLAQKDQEIVKLETEFINFKEEFINELKSLESNKDNVTDDAVKQKELKDKIKDLQFNEKKLVDEKEDLTQKLKENKKELKDLRFILKTKEDQIDQMSEKMDDMLADQKGSAAVDEDVDLKMSIRIQELENMRDGIIRAAALLGKELPDLVNTEEMIEKVDDLIIHGVAKYPEKIQEWKNEIYGEEISTPQLLLSDEEKLDDIEKKIEELDESGPEIDSTLLTEEPKEEAEPKLLLSEDKSKEYEERMKEEDDLMKMIMDEIPDISEMEATILQDQLLEVDKEDRKSRIEMYRLTKELEK